MCLSLVLQCVLQALLADAVRPTAREDAGAAIDFGKASQDNATMQAKDAPVKKRPTTILQVQPKSIHRPNISMLQVQRHQKLAGPELVAVDDQNGLDRQVDMAEFDETENDDLETQRGSSLEDDGLETEFQPSEIEPSRLDGVSTNALETHVDKVGNRERALEDTLHSGERDVATESVNEGERVQPKSILQPNEPPFKFKDADGLAGEYEQSADKMKEHVGKVDKAFRHVNDRMGEYSQSIQDLSTEFKKLGESAHGIHSKVLNEFGDKDKRLMCGFKNAERALADPPQPPIDCNTI